MKKLTFFVSKMDCPAETELIQLKLNSLPFVEHIEFDLQNHLVNVYHNGDRSQILAALNELNLQSDLRSESDATSLPVSADTQERRVLKQVLLINFSFFLLEVLTGIVAQSMGLIADGLDMLADAIVYGMALFAVGGAVASKKRVAFIAGILQSVLAVVGFVEVIRRFLGIEAYPHIQTMIIVSSLALIANASCVYLLHRSKSKGAHIQASLIFSSYDVLANLGVIIAAVLVHVFQSNKPDLIVGTLIFILVIEGAIRIFKLAK